MMVQKKNTSIQNLNDAKTSPVTMKDVLFITLQNKQKRSSGAVPFLLVEDQAVVLLGSTLADSNLERRRMPNQPARIAFAMPTRMKGRNPQQMQLSKTLMLQF